MRMYRILLNKSLTDITNFTKNGNLIFFLSLSLSPSYFLIFLVLFFFFSGCKYTIYCNWCVILQFLVWHVFFFLCLTFFILHILLWGRIYCRIFSNEYFLIWFCSREVNRILSWAWRSIKNGENIIHNWKAGSFIILRDTIGRNLYYI